MDLNFSGHVTRVVAVEEDGGAFGNILKRNLVSVSDWLGQSEGGVRHCPNYLDDSAGCTISQHDGSIVLWIDLKTGR